MGTTICKIPIEGSGSLAITTRPRGGDWLADDIASLKAQGIHVVVSLLCPEEARELGLADEADECRNAGLTFISLAVPDLGTPDDSPEFIRQSRNTLRLLQKGWNVAVHCRQGSVRSGLLAVAVLMGSRVPLETAVDLVSRIRGVTVPEAPAQLRWLHEHERQLSEPVEIRSGTLPEDRPISSNEAEVVVRLLLDASVVGSLAHLVATVPSLRVVGRCPCGCPSVDFEPAGQSSDRAGVIADGTGTLENGQGVGLMVWGRRDAVIGLELYEMGCPATSLPAAGSVRAW